MTLFKKKTEYNNDQKKCRKTNRSQRDQFMLNYVEKII